MQTIENKVINRIYGNGRGWAFIKNDLFDLGSSAATASCKNVDIVEFMLNEKAEITGRAIQPVEGLVLILGIPMYGKPAQARIAQFVVMFV